jgi:hypothetical protein
VTPGPSLAAITTLPKASTVEEEPEPEYSLLHYMDVEVKDGKGEFMTRRALVDGGSQGNCIQREFS